MKVLIFLDKIASSTDYGGSLYFLLLPGLLWFATDNTTSTTFFFFFRLTEHSDAMKGFLIFLVFGSLGTALPSDRRRASAPCPYHHGGDSPREPLIEDSYVVELHADYSLSKHFEFIGRNLSDDAQVNHFQFMRNFNSYGVRVDEDTLHNLIRYDPGVRAVSHNKVFNPEIWYLQHGERNETAPPEHLLAKRSWPDWHVRHTYGHWSREYLQKWDSKIPSWYSWWDMVSYKCQTSEARAD